MFMFLDYLDTILEMFIRFSGIHFHNSFRDKREHSLNHDMHDISLEISLRLGVKSMSNPLI